MLDIQDIVLCVVSSIRNEAYIKALGLRLLELRQAKQFSQEDLANAADIPINQVGRIERGEINTTVSTLYVIAKALDTTPSEILNFSFKAKK